MKPFIMKVNESGKPIMTAEEIQKMVEQAYNEGYKDGRNQTPIISVPSNDPNQDWWKKIQYSDHTTPLNGYGKGPNYEGGSKC